jgi:RND family efflux transporter MFP subunit
MKRTNLYVSLMTIIIMLGCSGRKETDIGKRQNTKEVRVETMVVTAENPDVMLNYSGIIVPSVKTSLSFQLPGQVKKIYAEEGDQVRQGQLLAEIDRTTFESSLQMALALQNQAHDSHERLKTVYEKGSLPEIQWEEVKSKLQQANSSVAIAEQNIRNCLIKAPADGVIGSRNIEVGSTTVPGISAFDLLTIDKVYVRISVPENEISKFKKGQKALVKIPAIGQDQFKAEVDKIGVMANMISKTYEVKLMIDNPRQLIKPGMACDINMSIPEEESISLPYEAVIKDFNDQEFVYLIEPSTGKAKKQIVEVGEFFNNELKVTSGLHVGDVVVVSGQHKLHDNADVIFN